MVNIVRPVLLLVAVLLLSFTSACSGGSGDPGDPYEGGKFSRSPSGSFCIVELHGTFRQMGRQYGLMLKDQLGEFYQEAVVKFLMGEKGISYADLVATGRNSYNQYPQIFKDFMDGTAETNGLDQEKTYIMSTLLTMIYETGCSSLSAWGDYTPDRSAVVGRNLDLASANLRRFSKYFHVVVWNPTGYPASVANIDFMGSVFFQTAMNSKGIFLELQNGESADTTSVPDRENTNNILLQSLFQNVSAADVDLWFKTTLPEAGLIMNASFPDHATIYEWATYRVAPRNGNGLISASNDFLDPSWHNYPIVFFDATNEGIGLTYTRRTNLMQLGELNKGNITPQKMMQIFDTTIPEGGATFPEGGLVKTIYSVVVQPSTQKIWLKVRGYSGWEEIDLKTFFSAN